MIVFNLGYLPGGDKSFTTTAETTVAAKRSVRALESMDMGGMEVIFK